jgi:hypothetical protein
MVSHVSALQGWHQRWACVWCHAANTGFSQHRDAAAATVADLAADVAGSRLRFGAGEPDQTTQPFPELPMTPAQADRVVHADHVVPGSPEVSASPGVSAGPGPASDEGRPRSGRPRQWRPRQWRPGRRWPGRRWTRLSWPGPRVAAVAVAGLALVVLVVAVGELSQGGPGAAARAGSSPGRRAVAVTASAVGAVDLRGVPGLLTIVGARSGQVRLTGVLHWSGRSAPVATRRLDRGGRGSRVLHLSYRCAPASPCTEDYRLVVPGRTAMVIRQPSGHVIVSGVAGALRILAASVDVSATGLRSPALAAQITSGHLSASFDVAPRQISVALVSAQATVRLPGGVGYLVSSQVSSGFVHVGIPRAADATRTVTARIDQGELQLLTT